MFFRKHKFKKYTKLTSEHKTNKRFININYQNMKSDFKADKTLLLAIKIQAHKSANKIFNAKKTEKYNLLKDRKPVRLSLRLQTGKFITGKITKIVIYKKEKSKLISHYKPN